MKVLEHKLTYDLYITRNEIFSLNSAAKTSADIKFLFSSPLFLKIKIKARNQGHVSPT